MRGNQPQCAARNTRQLPNLVLLFSQDPGLVAGAWGCQHILSPPLFAPMTSTLRRSGKISAKLRATYLVCLASPLLGLIALANPAQAANLVQNGGFENNSGPGYVFANPITNWTLNNTASSGVSINAINTLAQLQAAGNTSSTPIPLWGASAGYVNGNGFRNSNNGGYFIIADGFYAEFDGYKLAFMHGYILRECCIMPHFDVVFAGFCI